MYIISLILINFFIILDPGGAVNQIPERYTIAGDVRYIYKFFIMIDAKCGLFKFFKARVWYVKDWRSL